MTRFLMLSVLPTVMVLGPSTASRPAPRQVRTSRPRRVAEVVPSHSARALLHQAITDARRPDWSLLTSAHRLVRRARGDARALRMARGRLRRHTPQDLSTWQARALVALIVAVAEAEELRTAASVRYAS
jgi:hypothetical protein